MEFWFETSFYFTNDIEFWLGIMLLSYTANFEIFIKQDF